MYYQDRKHPRLKTYDYSQDGYYYVTICTKDKACTLGRVGRSGPERIPTVYLSPLGRIVKKYIDRIDTVYPQTRVDQYVIMPNHVHMILALESDLGCGGLGADRPTVLSVVHGTKAMVTKEWGMPVWQASFYEHVIRNTESYVEICRYISGNPGKWLAEDSISKKGIDL